MKFKQLFEHYHCEALFMGTKSLKYKATTNGSYKVSDDLEDGVLSFESVLLVSSDRDGALVRRLFTRKLNVDVEVLAQLSDDGSLAADDLGVVLWLDFDLDLVALGLAIGLFGLEIFQAFHQSLLSFLNIGRRSGNDDGVGLHLRLRDFDVHVEVIHQLTNAGALLTDNESVEFKGNLNLKVNNRKNIYEYGKILTIIFDKKNCSEFYGTEYLFVFTSLINWEDTYHHKKRK